jgi:hypothetical protein
MGQPFEMPDNVLYDEEKLNEVNQEDIEYEM